MDEDKQDYNKSEDNLDGNEDLFQNIVDNANEGFIITDLKSEIVYSNRRTSILIGYDNQELLGMNFEKLIHPDEVQKVINIFKSKIEREILPYRYETVFLSKYKEDIPIEYTITKIVWKGVKANLITISDISERKKAEKAVIKSEQLLDDILTASSVGIGYTVERKIIWANESMVKLFGFNNEEQYKNKDTRILYPNDKEYKRAGKITYDQLSSTGKVEFDTKYQRRDGSIFDAHVRVNLLKPDEPRKGMIACIIDITKRKQAELKLKESENKFRELYENIAGGTLIIGNDYIIKDVNDRTCEITGFTKQELIGEECDIICPKGSQSKSCPIWEENLDGFKGMDTTIKCKNGQKIPILKNAKRIKIENDFYILENFQDISERKRTEEMLKESEIKYREAYNKSDFYKDLIAHDMGNILSNIMSSIQLIEISRNKVEENEINEKLLKIVKTQVERGASLISNVRKLSFLEEKNVSIKKIELISLLDDAIDSIRSRFNQSNVKIKIETPQKVINAKGCDLLLDVFENILLNAIIHNHNDIKKIWIELSLIKHDNVKYVRLEFKDNAVGIIDERKTEIFERTYKKDKSTGGMGIGLSLVKMIINGYDGKIWVEDRIEGDHTKGSKFIILLKEV